MDEDNGMTAAAHGASPIASRCREDITKAEALEISSRLEQHAQQCWLRSEHKVISFDIVGDDYNLIHTRSYMVHPKGWHLCRTPIQHGTRYRLKRDQPRGLSAAEESSNSEGVNN